MDPSLREKGGNDSKLGDQDGITQEEGGVSENYGFGGETFEPERDGERLRRQLSAVRAAIDDGGWHTLGQLSKATGFPEASISARLRDLRKEKFGGHMVQRRYVSKGLWEYLFIEKDELESGEDAAGFWRFHDQ